MMELSDGYPMEAMFAQIAELSLEVGGIHCEPPHGWRRVRGDTVIHQDRYTDGSHRYSLSGEHGRAPARAPSMNGSACDPEITVNLSIAAIWQNVGRKCPNLTRQSKIDWPKVISAR